MSTIGTTLKQPRVFAHDAIALDDLCKATSGVLTGTVTSGGVGGYVALATYETTTNSTYGSGATIRVDTVIGPGIVQTFTIINAGEFYEAGDILTLVGGGSSDDCTIEVSTVGCTTWEFGDPITPMPNNFDTVPYWNEKTSYTYTTSLVGNPGPHQTPGPGAALYVGADMDITVINEAGTEVEYKGVKAGSFLPVSVLSVVAGPADLTDVLALF